MRQQESKVRWTPFQRLRSGWLGLSKLLITVLAIFLIGVGAFALSLVAPVDDLVNTAAQQHLSLESRIVSENLAHILGTRQGTMVELTRNRTFTEYFTALASGNQAAITTALNNLKSFLLETIQTAPKDEPWIEFRYLNNNGQLLASAFTDARGKSLAVEVDPGYLKQVSGLPQGHIYVNLIEVPTTGTQGNTKIGRAVQLGTPVISGDTATGILVTTMDLEDNLGSAFQ